MVFEPSAPRLAACWALLLLAAAGWQFGPRSSSPKSLLAAEARFFQGEVVEDPRPGLAGPRVVADVSGSAPAEEGESSAGSRRIVLQVVGNPEPPPARGDRVAFRGRLRPAQGFRNPGGSGFDSYAARLGIEARSSAVWPGGVAFAVPGAGTPAWLRWRRDLSGAMREEVPGSSGAILRALTIGDCSGVAPETWDSFRRAGTTHLIAISGQHLGILAVFLVPCLRWILARVPGLPLRHPVDPIARALTLPVLFAYSGLAGFQTSTVRALTTAGLVVLATALSRFHSTLALLCSTALVVALPQPAVLWDPGFQLSLAGLAGLFWLAPLFERRLTRARSSVEKLLPRPGLGIRALRRVLREARTGICTSVATTLTTAPLSMFHFGSTSLIGFAANLPTVPLIGFFCLPLGLAGIGLRGLSAAAAGVLWRAAGLGLDGLVWFQDSLTRHVPILSVSSLRTPLALVGTGCLLGWLSVYLQGRGRSKAAALLVTAGVAAIAVPPAARWGWARVDPRAHLWVLDVGQGQALALRFPGGRWAVVDGGGFVGTPFDTGERVVAPALEALGARRLGFAVSTHPHPDHLGGMRSLLRWGRPEFLWLPAPFAGDPRYEPLLEQARILGTRVVWVGSDRVEAREGDARIEAVSPEGTKENDRCLVLRISLGRSAALLPADVEADGQKWLVQSGFPLRSDLVVAPHHGSAVLAYPLFLSAAAPSWLFVSTGDRLRSPSPEEIDGTRDIRILSTNETGFLHAWLDHDHCRVESGP